MRSEARAATQRHEEAVLAELRQTEHRQAERATALQKELARTRQKLDAAVEALRQTQRNSEGARLRRWWKGLARQRAPDRGKE